MNFSRAFALASICLLASGCRRHHHDRAGFDEPDAAQRALAVTAATHFQAQFNAGVYEFAYDEATPHFRSDDPREWRRQCALLKDELGSWKSFENAEVELWSEKEPIVAVFGIARFEKGARELGTAWKLEGNSAHLFEFMFRPASDARWTQFPVRLMFNGPMIDPPLRRSGSNSASL